LFRQRRRPRSPPAQGTLANQPMLDRTLKELETASRPGLRWPGTRSRRRRMAERMSFRCYSAKVQMVPLTAENTRFPPLCALDNSETFRHIPTIICG